MGLERQAWVWAAWRWGRGRWGREKRRRALTTLPEGGGDPLWKRRGDRAAQWACPASVTLLPLMPPPSPLATAHPPGVGS